MAVHDWTKVSQGILHHFHNAWALRLADALNDGILPASVYALSEQVAGETAPDLLALELVTEDPERRKRTPRVGHPGSPGVTTVLPPPKATIIATTENVSYASLRKTVVIRHVEGHTVVALIEIASRANKSSKAELERFLSKAQSALKQHVHLLVVDVYPPGRLDPQGLHGALWSALGQTPPEIAPDKPFLAASYEAAAEVTAYVEPFGLDDPVPEIPLFLEIGSYVNVPLQAAYDKAFASVPAFWRTQLSR